MTDNSDRRIKVRILALALLSFLLSAKSDRYYPLPENLSEPIFQAILIPYTLFFFIVFFIFLKPELADDFFAFLDSISATRLTIVFLLIFEAMALILLLIQDIGYALFGYHLNMLITILLFTSVGIALVYLFFRDASQNLLFVIAMATYTGTYLISINSFPLNSQRSDMLPLILSGCQSFLAGMTPYGYHSIPHHLVFTYLPGMWIAYLPAATLGIDPRFINLICIIISVLILIYSENGFRHYTMLLTSIFLLTPYLQYRHEIYLGVLLLILSIIFFFFRRNNWTISSAVFGYALATYQFVWIIFPFYVVSALRKWGLRRAITIVLIAFTVAMILILPFFLNTPEFFIEGVYGHWFFVNVLSVNLSYLVSLVVPWDLIIFIQGFVMVILLAMALQKMDPKDLWGWMATSLVLFIALNRVIEVYFYLLVLFLLLMHGIATYVPSEKPD